MIEPETGGEKPVSPASSLEEEGFAFDERYAEAFFHVRHQVLGVSLRPFSAWHRTVLEYVNSPVMLGSHPSPADLRFAVEVCRRGFPDMPLAPSGLWGRLCAESTARRDLARAARRPDLHDAGVKAFFRYIDDYVSLPKVTFGGRKGNTGTSGGQVPDIDSTLMDVAIYRYYTGCPRPEPWDIPLGELSWMATAMAKTQGGDLHVVSTEEEAMLRRLKAKLKEGEK